MEVVSVLIALMYFGVSGFGVAALSRSSERNKRLLIPLLVNFLTSGVLLLALWSDSSILNLVNPLGQQRQEIFVTVLLIGIFAVSVEFPGFLLNIQYDNKLVVALNYLEQAILSARLDPSLGIGQIGDVLDSQGAALSSAGLQAFVKRCLEEFSRIQNINLGLIDAMQRQLEIVRIQVRERSKHPFPLLIQILGLSSIGFILGEILANLRVR